MTRIEQYLSILRNQQPGTLQGHDPQDALLREMLVHAAFADGIVNEDEFELLERLVPDLDVGEVLVWVATTAQTPLDVDRLIASCASATDRSALLDLAREMVAIDRRVDPGEHRFLMNLSAACEPRSS